MPLYLTILLFFSSQGDSGSPLVCTKTNADSSKSNILVGIASGAYPGQNAFFTRVSAYTDYIHGCAKINESSFLIICTFTLIQNCIGLLSFDLLVFNVL